MAARTGEEFLKGLSVRPRWVTMDGRLIDDVASDPLTKGAARTLAGVFDRQHEFPDDCLIPDDETGELINISHMHPRSIEDLRKRVHGAVAHLGVHRRSDGAHSRLHEHEVRQLRCHTQRLGGS